MKSLTSILIAGTLFFAALALGADKKPFDASTFTARVSGNDPDGVLLDWDVPGAAGVNVQGHEEMATRGGAMVVWLSRTKPTSFDTEKRPQYTFTLSARGAKGCKPLKLTATYTAERGGAPGRQ